jgi:hypothetical protein
MVTNYFFDFNNLKILGGFKNKVHVLGIKDTYDETSIPKIEVGVSYSSKDFPENEIEECILSIDRKLFHKMLGKWLDNKLDYCDRWNHYCGVGGLIYCENVKKEYDTYIYDYIDVEDSKINDGLKEVKKDMVVYTVNSFDELIDMEHG